MIAKTLIESGLSDTVKLFYSYSRKDKKAVKAVEKAIAGFEWDIIADTIKKEQVLQWYDEGIEGGEKWDTAIKQFLRVADVILLFVTNNFFKSKYIAEVELELALERNRQGEARVIPILIDNTEPSWLESSFKHLQPLPQNCLPINEWEDKEAALRDVAQNIINIIINEGLFPHSRSRWLLHLETHIEQFSQQKQKQLVESLRKLSEDETLRFFEINTGSLLLTMDSTKDGFKNVLKLHQDNKLGSEIGCDILSITELLGSNIKVGSFISGKEMPRRPEKLPDPKLILLPSEAFVPTLLKSIKVNKISSLNFHHIINTGNEVLEDKEFDSEVSKHLEYLLTVIAIPEDELYVNLAPDENAKLLSESMENTRLGRDLLEVDYKLKRLAASLVHPSTVSGRKFWSTVYDRAFKELGTSELPYYCFQRIWMVPEKAVVYEGDIASAIEYHENPEQYQDNKNPYEQEEFIQASVINQHLKILSERQYKNKNATIGSHQDQKANAIIDDTFEKLIIPIIEKEVNEGKNFQIMRQIYNCMILSMWLKSNQDRFPWLKKYVNTRNPRQLMAQVTSIKPYSFRKTEKRSANSKDKTGKKPLSIKETHQGEYNKNFEQGIKLRTDKKFKESEIVLRKVFEKRSLKYGTDHFQTQIARSQLGRTLRAMGKFNEAVKLHEENLEIRRRCYGNIHEYSINAMKILADTLEMNRETIRAKVLRHEAAEHTKKYSKAFEIYENRVYYEKYLEVYRNGVFYLERYDYDKNLKKKIPRVYFSGALDFRDVSTSTFVASMQ